MRSLKETLAVAGGIAGIGLAALAAYAAPATAQAPAGDAVAGKVVFARCMACHSVAAGQNKLGPTLAGVIGRKAGTVAGFAYSPAMKAAPINWTPDKLDAYLTAPRAVVPGTKMIFAGMPKPADRANVIAYLANPK